MGVGWGCEVSPAEQLAAAEADLTATRAKAEAVRLELVAKEKAIDELEADRKLLQVEYQSYGFGWTRYGKIQAAEAEVEKARQALADETAPKVLVDRLGREEQWVLVAATPAQVKARPVGEPSDTLFRRGRRGWESYRGRLINYDHDAAMAWYAAQKKVKA